MASAKRNSALYIDKEALATLAMIQEGIFSPVTSLMDQKTAQIVDSTQKYKDRFFPFSLLLAPSGRRNAQTLKNAKKGDKLNLIVDGKNRGFIIAQEVFPIDRKKRIELIFSTSDENHPGVKDILKRLGDLAIYGEFEVEYPNIKEVKTQIKEAQKEIEATSTAAMMLNAKPLHRAHERMIRSALGENDLVVLFLQKQYKEDLFSYDLRYKGLEFYIQNYLPKSRVLIVPFENTYIFAGYNNIILDSIAVKNFGCDKLIIGENHSGIGTYYDKRGIHTYYEKFKEEHPDILIRSEYVYCNECRTLVSTKTCPHGTHHHIKYQAGFLQGLLKVGLLPPAVLVRKEISAIYLSTLFPNRFDDLIKKYNNYFPNDGLIEELDDEKIYLEIMKLHQTVSLT
ncbi:MAG: sulfate adenylyltransferase [Sulfurospirillum sp.]|nr:MAG: sulfate adenylyltransferase [Sulfurospirillum sp.]